MRIALWRIYLILFIILVRLLIPVHLVCLASNLWIFLFRDSHWRILFLLMNHIVKWRTFTQLVEWKFYIENLNYYCIQLRLIDFRMVKNLLSNFQQLLLFNIKMFLSNCKLYLVIKLPKWFHQIVWFKMLIINLNNQNINRIELIFLMMCWLH